MNVEWRVIEWDDDKIKSVENSVTGEIFKLQEIVKTAKGNWKINGFTVEGEYLQVKFKDGWFMGLPLIKKL